jgi:hypothetical protein
MQTRVPRNAVASFVAGAVGTSLNSGVYTGFNASGTNVFVFLAAPELSRRHRKTGKLTNAPRYNSRRAQEAREVTARCRWGRKQARIRFVVVTTKWGRLSS